jgi:signal transduction histidine kinase
MIVASGMLAIVVGGAFAAVLLTIDDLQGTTDLRRQTREAIIAADALEQNIIDLETGLRGFVITRDATFLQPSNDARASLPHSTRNLERLAADEPAQLARVRGISRAVDAYVRQYALPLVAAVRRDDPSVRSVKRTLAGKKRVDALRDSLTSFRTAERARLATRDADVDTAAHRATAAAVVGIAGSILLILIFAGYLTRVIVRPLRRAAAMANRLAGGDLSARMPETDVAEIAELQRSLNVMAGSLETSRDELASLLAEQAALRRVATLVAQGAAPAEVFDTVTREVGVLSGADLARMERYDSDNSVVGVAGWSRAEVPELAVGTRFSLEGASIAAMVHEASRPVRVDSFAGAHGPIAREAQDLGIRSSVGCPIVVEGRLWGVIAASSKSETPFPSGTESQIAEFTELVATAIANAEARAEVAASRARIVAAADEERRRVVRDLHDGAQQRLVHTILTLKLARRALEDEPESAADLVAEALDNAERGTAELRELAHGILPTLLTKGGLRAGVDSLASRSPVPVEVDVSADRFPAAIEATAYFVVAEALTNVAKHAHAEHAEVTTRVADGTLTIEVHDDGAGGARRSGSGLVGLADRVAALDGRLRIESPPDDGTLITAAIPLA